MAGLRVGGDTGGRYDLRLDLGTGELAVEWGFAPVPGSALAPRQERHIVPAEIVGLGSLCTWFVETRWSGQVRLGLHLAGSQVSARLATPIWWEEAGQPTYWSSLATVGSTVTATADGRLYSIDEDGTGTGWPDAASWVSETRVWQVQQDRHPRIGICLPEANQVRWGTVPVGREERWPEFLRLELGPWLGREQGSLFYPLSFAGGPDGRINVLDAANARVVVFNRDSRYLTQFGRPGRGPGEFDFGSGMRITKGRDYGGSICVDSEGYVYVADLGNQRIQKFEP